MLGASLGWWKGFALVTPKRLCYAISCHAATMCISLHLGIRLTESSSNTPSKKLSRHGEGFCRDAETARRRSLLQQLV